MNPYEPPASDPRDRRTRPIRWSVAWIRTFALFHAGLTLVLVLLTSVMLQQGLKRVASLNDEAYLRTLANPKAFVSGERRSAALDLSIAALTSVAAAVGAVLAAGLWRLRRWSRRLAIPQLALLAAAVSLPAMGISENLDFAEVYPYLLPVAILGLFTLSFWWPRFAAGFAPAAGGSAGSGQRPEPA